MLDRASALIATVGLVAVAIVVAVVVLAVVVTVAVGLVVLAQVVTVVVPQDARVRRVRRMRVVRHVAQRDPRSQPVLGHKLRPVPVLICQLPVRRRRLLSPRRPPLTRVPSRRSRMRLRLRSSAREGAGA